MAGDSAKRYGPKYGKRIRNKISSIEESEKSGHRCPECGSTSLKKESKGVWVCKKCGEKVAGGAWKPETGAKKMVKKALRKAGEE